MFQTNETCTALEECYLMSNIPKRNLASGCHLLKKIDQPSWRTTRRNYKHILQIVCISSRFRVLHPFSWEFQRSEVLWRYTVILVCHLQHVEVGWFIQNYPHTMSHRSFVINMYVVTMAWRCISPWSFHRSPQRRREMDIFRYISRFPRILNKNNQKKDDNLDWTLVNPENLRAEIVTCQR